MSSAEILNALVAAAKVLDEHDKVRKRAHELNALFRTKVDSAIAAMFEAAWTLDRVEVLASDGGKPPVRLRVSFSSDVIYDATTKTVRGRPTVFEETTISALDALQQLFDKTSLAWDRYGFELIDADGEPYDPPRAVLYARDHRYPRHDLAKIADPSVPPADPLRCRYTDCVEGHPVAVDEDDEDYVPEMGPVEQVTCPTCRRDLGLPNITKENDL